MVLLSQLTSAMHQVKAKQRTESHLCPISVQCPDHIKWYIKKQWQKSLAFWKERSPSSWRQIWWKKCSTMEVIFIKEARIKQIIQYLKIRTNFEPNLCLNNSVLLLSTTVMVQNETNCHHYQFINTIFCPLLVKWSQLYSLRTSI